ncbi:ubiquitin carboxyl-terminal hydrolase family protein [Medicago truncatula]|uniref:Ubiquitin carboxyl-terminal hydrolase family protein n=2 Tax=Medicago truncatula TaxID=3880 RepID=A0A072UVZ6_MEDTR|nr:ubiquitin carboxyl-terminal hydrolase family protein [Medicago truncatula]
MFRHQTNIIILLRTSSKRHYCLWSSKKDPDLESALSRNKRWIINNQIKNIILRYPNNQIPIQTLQKKFKTLDLQGKALNWISKYPSCFQFHQDHVLLTKRMMELVHEEQSLKDSLESVFVPRLAKLLMLSLNNCLNVMKINEIKNSLGFPDDYLIGIVAKYPDLFRIRNESGRRSSMVVELMKWNPDFAVSEVEALAMKNGVEVNFSCCLPSSWVKSLEKFREFELVPYVSPYSDPRGLVEGSKEMEKRNVGLVHELLSLTLWKKISIMKLGHFKREFFLPDKVNVLLLKHPGIFYVSNKYRIYTVLLREGYVGSQLVDKDPLVVVKEKFGEIMQEGLHEYNQRRRLVNIEKRRNKGLPLNRVDEDHMKGRRRRRNREVFDEDDEVERENGNKLGGLLDPEERKRFYKVLFDDDGSATTIPTAKIVLPREKQNGGELPNKKVLKIIENKKEVDETICKPDDEEVEFFFFSLANILENRNQPQDVEDITNKVFPPPPVCYNASLNFQHIFSEHLMKALLERRDGLAQRIFTKAGLDNTSVLQVTDNFIAQQPKVTGGTSGPVIGSHFGSHFVTATSSSNVRIAALAALAALAASILITFSVSPIHPTVTCISGSENYDSILNLSLLN